MVRDHALFIYDFKSIDGLEEGASYFEVLAKGRMPEEVAIEANARLKAIAKKNTYVITNFRVSNDEMQQFLKV